LKRNMVLLVKHPTVRKAIHRFEKHRPGATLMDLVAIFESNPAIVGLARSSAV